MTIWEQIKADIDGAIKENLLEPAMIERGKGWIDQLAREFPIEHRILMTVIYNRPEVVLRALALWDKGFRGLEKNPLALKYVGLLQDRLRGNGQ